MKFYLVNDPGLWQREAKEEKIAVEALQVKSANFRHVSLPSLHHLAILPIQSPEGKPLSQDLQF